jgi:site-specific DNA recombinase
VRLKIALGRLRHKSQIHDGLHAAIVDQETWERVQRRLAEQTQPRAAPRRNAESFLAGKLYDDRGNRMGPSHAAKGGRRWRYYISRASLAGRKSEAGSVTRVPAARIEKQVFDAIKSIIASRYSIAKLGALTSVGCSGNTVGSGHATRDRWLTLADHEGVLDAIERVTIGATATEIQLSDAVVVDGEDRTLTVPWIPPSPYQRREIIQGEDEPHASISPMRVRARTVFAESLRNAHCWLNELITDPDQAIETIAGRERRSERSIRMTLSLAFVAPRRRRGNRRPSSARVRIQATDGFADGLVPPMDRARPQSSGSELIDSRAATTTTLSSNVLFQRRPSLDWGNGILRLETGRRFRPLNARK